MLYTRSLQRDPELEIRGGRYEERDMIWKNVEIHNVEELIEKDGGVTWRRIPASVRERMETEAGKNAAVSATGVELRFVMKSEEVKIRMSSESTTAVFHVFRGAIQGGYEDHETSKHVSGKPQDFVIHRSGNLELLRNVAEEFGQEWDPAVVRVIFDRGGYTLYDIEGEVEPPRPEQCPSRTMMAYGSSITHGSNSIDASHSWVWQVAEHRKMDQRNLGIAGGCAMEPEIVEYIAAEGEKKRWDLALLELGINVLDWPEEKIHTRVENTLAQIAGRNPDKPIYVISPFYCFDDYYRRGNAQRWREIIAKEAAKSGLPNVTYINGLSLLENMSLISADAVHPNIYGVQQIAERLIKYLERS